MASERLFDRISAVWSNAEWRTRPTSYRSDEALAAAKAELERVNALQQAAQDLSDRQVAEQFPEFRNQLFSPADLKRLKVQP